MYHTAGTPATGHKTGLSKCSKTVPDRPESCEAGSVRDYMGYNHSYLTSEQGERSSARFMSAAEKASSYLSRRGGHRFAGHRGNETSGGGLVFYARGQGDRAERHLTAGAKADKMGAETGRGRKRPCGVPTAARR